jgi:hypothetical protein
MLYPPLPSRIGKPGTLTQIDGKRQHFVVLDEVTQVQSTYSGKVICLQKIRFDETGVTELRLGYYIIGKKPRMAGKWVWGQYATLMPIRDFKAILRKATQRKWI